MDPRQRLVPLTKATALVSALLLGPGLAKQAQGQQTELFACTPYCREVMAAVLLDCDPPLIWTEVPGRAWWGPLTWQGPIQISIQARPVARLEPMPLYFELRLDSDSARNCIPYSGGAIRWETLGTSSCDSLWVHSEPINVPLEPGTRYWVQSNGFSKVDGEGNLVASSPYVRCIWIRRAPVAVASWSWSRVKALYR